MGVGGWGGAEYLVIAQLVAKPGVLLAQTTHLRSQLSPLRLPVLHHPEHLHHQLDRSSAYAPSILRQSAYYRECTFFLVDDNTSLGHGGIYCIYYYDNSSYLERNLTIEKMQHTVFIIL